MRCVQRGKNYESAPESFNCGLVPAFDSGEDQGSREKFAEDFGPAFGLTGLWFGSGVGFGVHGWL
jgi:hypothetical protein